MKKDNTFLYQSSIGAWLVFLFACAAISTFTSCSGEDDIPPPSAYVPPMEDSTGACPFIFITPTLSGETVLDFECEGPEEFSFFGESNSSINISYADNPDATGINTSEKVVEVMQGAGVEGWAGFFFDLSEKVDFSANNAIKLKVYSSYPEQTVNLKLEDSTDGSISKELSVVTTLVDEWEEVSFAFTPTDSDKFDRFVLFFNFFGDKDVETVHYFDDVTMGTATVVAEPDPVPSVAAPFPFASEDVVISLFSNAYTNVPVDTWRTDWSNATLLDTMIQGDDVKQYSDLNFVGIETVMNQIDATAMTHFHTDIWTASATEIRIKLVDFGPNGMYDNGGDDSEHEILIENPSLEEWVSLDIPLADFTGLTSRANIAQLIYSAATSGPTVFMDNIYFYDIAGVVLSPLSPAPVPTFTQANVISMFSDAYADVPVDTWRTDWSDGALEDTDVMGDAVKQYSALNFVGIETVMNQIDATAMSHFHLDFWTANATEFRVKLVDFGLNGMYDNGGDDSEHEIVIENPTQEEWVSLDIPLADFTGLASKANIAQVVLSGNPAGQFTVFIDNVFFHNNMNPNFPSAAASTPTLAADNVISMYSDAYTNVTVDTWRTDWSDAAFEEVSVAGNPTLNYTELNFVGAETVMNQIDATNMTHFHLNVWSPNAEEFRIKLVDFGANGVYDNGGDDREHELTFTTLTAGEWNTLDIPLADFTELTTRANIAQLIFSGNPSGDLTVFIDNVLFHN